MWNKIDVIFALKSPLHIGYVPFKGSVVSPTRYYVTGRTLWGAITKYLTEYLYGIPKADNYKSIGLQVQENFRFSYFYLYDGKNIYFPFYTEKGLRYGNNEVSITKSEFEHKFIGSRISTAIDDNGTAKDESLHEIEFINNKFKDENGNIHDTKLAGFIWVKNDALIEGNEIKLSNGIFVKDCNIIQELILGGESKYGLGHVVMDSTDTSIDKSNEDEIKVKIKSRIPLMAHLEYDKSIRFKGDIELITGRGYYDTKDINKAGVIKNEPEKPISKFFTPGTVLDMGINMSINTILNWDGTLITNHRDGSSGW